MPVLTEEKNGETVSPLVIASGGRSQLLADCGEAIIALLAIVAHVVSPMDWELEKYKPRHRGHISVPFHLLKCHLLITIGHEPRIFP